MAVEVSLIFLSTEIWVTLFNVFERLCCVWMHMLCLIYSQRKYPVEILACLDSNSGTKLYIQLSWQLCSWDNEILTQMLGRTSHFWRGCLTGEKKSPVELWVLHLHPLPEDLDAISPSALVCWHCCDRGPPAGWLMQQKLIIWPFQRLNIQFKVLASCFLPEAVRERSAPSLSLCFVGNHVHVLRMFFVLPSHHLHSLCLSVQVSPFCKDTRCIRLEPTLMTSF